LLQTSDVMIVELELDLIRCSKNIVQLQRVYSDWNSIKVN
jgi:hypothetical protein